MKRWVPVISFIVIFAAGAVYLPGFSKYLALKRRETQLADDIKRLQKEIDVLKEEEHLLKTDVARLEEVVREELGLVKPGEVIYRMVEERDRSGEEAPDKKLN